MRTFIVLAAISLFVAAPASAGPRPIDADGDGIPRQWELLHGTSDSDATDALLDFDGDGLDTRAEFLTNGRPWGNYELLACPLEQLPFKKSAVPAIHWTEFIAANRSGEYLINVTVAAGTHTFLWNPPGGPVAGPVFTRVPVVLTYGVPFNDHGQILHGQFVRSVRDWKAPCVSIPWSPAAGETALALSNDARVLLRTDSRGRINGYRGAWQSYQWRGAETSSDILSLGYDPERFTLTLHPAADPASGGWFLGHLQRLPSLHHHSQPLAWGLETSGYPLPLPPLPDKWTGAAFHAAAAGRAAGAACDAAGQLHAVLLDENGWRTISGGAAGSSPWVFALSDRGVALGWNFGITNTAFLWKDRSIALAKALPPSAAGLLPSGLTGSGSLYGLDYAEPTTAPRPVVFRPLPSTLGDGAHGNAKLHFAPPNKHLSPDSDGDGIPDHRESAAGLRSDLLDSDGDGWADLHEIVRHRHPLKAESTRPAAPAGLAVFTPQQHPLTVQERP